MAVAQQAATGDHETNNRTSANHRNLTMRDFFKPWRRKVGVATLAMACVFAGAWVRGLVRPFVLSVDAEPGREYVFHIDSDAVRVADERFTDVDLKSRTVISVALAELRVPHWCATIPLTLLSAYLLLNKPRVVQKPTTEPSHPPKPDDA